MVRNTVDCIQWFKLDKNFFNIPENIYICSTYIAPEGSPTYENFDSDLFENIESDIRYFQSLSGKVFVLGDFNARTAGKTDYIDHDQRLIDCEEIDSPVACSIPRAHCDRGSNRFGDCLLEMCKAVNLQILNGRVGKDYNIGNFTCYTHNGESTVDYLLTSFQNFDCIFDFTVHAFNIYSNHAPLSFTLKVNSVKVNSNKDNKKVIYRWNNDYKEDFIKDISSTINNLNKDLEEKIAAESDADTLVQIFTEYVNNIDNKYFEKHCKISKNANFCDHSEYPMKEWFDDVCKQKKIIYEKALEQYNAYKNETTRQNFLAAKRDYKYQCKTAKRKYTKKNCKRFRKNEKY